MNAEYFQTQVRKISDADLFSAFDGVSDYEGWAAHWAAARSRVLVLNADEFLASWNAAAVSLETQRETILERASRIIAHEITGWGDVTIAHGTVVDFNADYGEAGQYGFHYWDWARPLIQAFLLTRDRMYLATFDELFNQWYEQRDAVKGRIETLNVIWYELGLARRGRVFLEFYALANDLPRLTHERMLKTLLGSARGLHEEQKTGYRLGNWQVMGAYALGLIALSVPEFRESVEWLRMAVDRLAWHLEKDFYPDGCHWERCPSSYMLTVFRDLRNLATLLERTEKHAELAARLAGPLERSLKFYHSIVPDDHVISALNDGGRARLPDSMLAEIEKLNLGPARSEQHVQSGFSVLRDQSHHILINHGPPAGGHTHLDALSFELHAFGVPMLIDSGIGLTYDDPHYATWYRRATAHNMLTICDADPDRKATRGEAVVCVDQANHAYFAATHRGYESSHGLLHRRHILFIKPEYIIIYDVLSAVSSPAAGGAQLTFHLHSPLKFVQFASGFFSPVTPGLLVIPANSDWKASQAKALASVTNIPGYTADHAEVDWLRFHGRVLASEPTRFAVLLCPFEKQPPNGSFEADFTHQARAKFVVGQNQRSSTIVIPDDPADGLELLLNGPST